VFLLRRARTRVPIRDAYIGYFAGLSLLFAPLLAGEIAVRAIVLRSRCGVGVATVIAVNLWERLLDVVALAALVAGAGLLLGRTDLVTGAAAGFVLSMAIPPVRHRVLAMVAIGAQAIGRIFEPGGGPLPLELASESAWWAGFAASVAAWLLPPLALLALVHVWGVAYGILPAQYDYAAASSFAGLTLAPGGILVTGNRLAMALQSQGLPIAQAALTVIGVRLATAGVATALGGVMLLVHWATAPAGSASHFDDIAQAYDVQIPEARRLSLLTRKTEMMRDVIERMGVGRRGLDVGCGQGAYVARMRDLGFEAHGIDASSGQVRIAARRFDEPGVVSVGSALQIQAADESYDFVYTINVVHHLGSVEEQRRAFVELLRVLKPGGLLFVHEINTRNILFRFYMGYVFPSLNCIDEGVERWLRPDRLGTYTDVPVAEIGYFTFLPDFLPDRIVRSLQTIERWLEASKLRVYSAHYMAIWRKP
jgi:ubiquinone/menaquinone biosynthesis C-methylase UbiE